MNIQYTYRTEVPLTAFLRESCTGWLHKDLMHQAVSHRINGNLMADRTLVPSGHRRARKDAHTKCCRSTSNRWREFSAKSGSRKS